MLTERCYAICRYLFDQEKPVTIKKLADRFFVSERTIRYDLDIVEQWLKDRGVMLSRKSKVGICIETNQVEYETVKDFFNNPAEVQQVYSAEERKKIIRGLLLQANHVYSVNDLAKKCNVSKSTVSADLNEVEQWFRKYNIQMVRRPNYGIDLNFDEKSWRKAVVDHIYEVHDKEKLLSLLDISKVDLASKSRLSDITKNEIFGIIGDTDLDVLEECVNEIEKEMNIIFTDGALAGLLVHLGVAVNRIRAGKEIRMPKEQLDNLRDLKEFELSKQALKKIQKIFNIVFPEDEAGYFTMHIMGARLNRQKNEQDSEDAAVNEFINEVCKEIRIDLQDDKDLYDGLMTHIKPALWRSRYGIRLYNPILDTIKVNYSQLFDVIYRKSSILNDYFKIELDENELGYLAVHFGAAIERKRSNPGMQSFISAAVVCSSGLGTTKMLSSKIRSEFSEINILYEMSIIDFENFDKDSVDVIFTTLPIDTQKYPNMLFVNAFLTDEDKANIRKFISGFFTTTRNSGKIIDKMIYIINRNCTINDENNLRKDLEKLLFYSRNDNEITDQSLSTYLDLDHIKVKCHARDWKQAVQIAGNILYEHGEIRENYIYEMIRNVIRFNSYIVITKGVAMPHGLKENVIKPSFSLITLDEPVEFGHKYNDPVSIVLCMAAKDEDSHIEAMMQFMYFLEDENNKRKLNECQTAEEAKGLIDGFVKKLSDQSDAAVFH